MCRRDRGSLVAVWRVNCKAGQQRASWVPHYSDKPAEAQRCFSGTAAEQRASNGSKRETSWRSWCRNQPKRTGCQLQGTAPAVERVQDIDAQQAGSWLQPPAQPATVWQLPACEACRCPPDQGGCGQVAGGSTCSAAPCQRPEPGGRSKPCFKAARLSAQGGAMSMCGT